MFPRRVPSRACPLAPALVRLPWTHAIPPYDWPQTEKKLGLSNVKLVQAVGQQRFTKGVLRAKEIRLTKLERDAANRKPGEGGGGGDGDEGEGEEEGTGIEVDEDALLAESTAATAALIAKVRAPRGLAAG